MNGFWWGAHTFAWLWGIPLGFLALCLVLLFVYLFRGPRWFCSRRDRHDLTEAAREILDRRYASGEITREQYEEMRHVIGC